MNASAAALTALATAVGADHREIDALFRTSRCTDLYVDVGSNRGVQLRKLYEPDKYKGAPMLSIFRRRFGGAGTSTFCHVCAIGIEANPRHSDRLNELQRRYRAAGIPLLILHPVAASDADGVAADAAESVAGYTRLEKAALHSALTNLTQRSGCGTRISSLDDETYALSESKPWPHGRLCPSVSAVRP